MDQSIRALCSSFSSVLDHAESSSHELADAVSQRPIHLEMARTSFLQNLEHRVEASTADLQHIESIALDTVSFQELLGHCGESLNVNARHVSALQSHLATFGYEPADAEEPEVVDVDVEDGDVGKIGDLGDGCVSVSRSVTAQSWKMKPDLTNFIMYINAAAAILGDGTAQAGVGGSDPGRRRPGAGSAHGSPGRRRPSVGVILLIVLYAVPSSRQDKISPPLHPSGGGGGGLTQQGRFMST